MNKAIFLDRDGVINEEVDLLNKPEQLKLIKGSADAIKLLNKDFYVIITTNQPQIARGLCSEKDIQKINEVLKKELEKYGARIDGIYYCPHHPEAKIERYRVDCNCRKPKPGMLIKAEEELNIDLKQSYMVGDKLSDIEAGRRAGCKTIMVKTGYGEKELRSNQIECDYVTDDLYDAVEHILYLCRKL